MIDSQRGTRLYSNVSFGDYSIIHDDGQPVKDSPPGTPEIKKKRTTSQHEHHVEYDPNVHGPMNLIGTLEEAKRYRPWLVYNPFIEKGYRINFLSYKKLLFSSVQCHNETTNFWSHFCGALLFIFLLLHFAVYFSLLSFNVDIVAKAESYAYSQEYLTDSLAASITKARDMAQFYMAGEQMIGKGLTVNEIIEEMRALETGFKGSLRSIDVDQMNYYS